MDTEEFTFPITTTDPSTESPPLWRVSPSASPTLIDYDQGSTSTTSVNANNQHHKHPRKVERSSSTKDYSSVLLVKECHRNRRSFSSLEGIIMKKRSELAKDSEEDDDDDSDQEEEEEEDKMDMLWENLNEEMWKDREKTVKYNVSKGDIGFGCVPSSSPKLSSKMNGAAAAAVISNKKSTNVLLILKVLKKIFLIQHTQQPAVKKRSCSW